MQTAIQKGLKEIGRGLTKNSPTILTGLAVGGLVTTTILAVRATPKALRILEEEREKRESFCDGRIGPCDKKTAVLLTWKCYLPAVIMGGISIGCIIGANSINLRRNAALASIYSISETALREYQAKVVEIIGDKKEKAVRDEIAKDRVAKNPVANNEIILTTYGETLCYDSWSGRYFKSDIEKIRQTCNDANAKLLCGMDDYISLNDLYYELGLSSVKMGEETGWSLDATGMLEFDYSSVLATDGTPCLVLEFKVSPKYEYDC